MAQNISFNGTAYSTLKSKNPGRSDVPNVTWKRTTGGKERAVKFGDSVRRRSYLIWLDTTTSPSQEVAWDAFISSLSGLSLTFTFIDHRGVSFPARFNSPPVKEYDDVDDALIPIDVIEVLT